MDPPSFFRQRFVPEFWQDPILIHSRILDGRLDVALVTEKLARGFPLLWRTAGIFRLLHDPSTNFNLCPREGSEDVGLKTFNVKAAKLDEVWYVRMTLHASTIMLGKLCGAVDAVHNIPNSHCLS